MLRRLAISLCLTALFGCSGSDEPDAGTNPDATTTPRDGGVDTPDSGVAVDAGIGMDAATTPDAGPNDDNESFDEALDAMKNADRGVTGKIGWGGDRDYFSFAGTAGEFILVTTDSQPRFDGNQVDTVIRLYDSGQAQLAQNDDAVPRVDVNSELIYRIPADGTYYVEVLEFSDWNGDEPEGRDDFIYALRVQTLEDTNPRVTVATETGNDAASATALGIDETFGLLCGDYADASDVDVFTVGHDRADGSLAFDMMPPGTDGHGSTTPVGTVWITDATGMDVIARRDFGTEDVDFSPSIPAGDYLLWLQHPGGTAGANDFYAVKTFVQTENDPEVEPNNDLATAEVRPLAARTDGSRASFVLSHLPDGDVDYFAVVPADGEMLTVVCGSAVNGSGVQGLRVRLLDAQGQVVAEATEPADDLARIEDQTVTSTAYVALDKTGQDPAVSGDFVRCGIIAATE